MAVGLWQLIPPSAMMVWPEIYLESSDARNAIMLAISSGLPAYGSELYFMNVSRSSSLMLSKVAGVRTSPGATQLQRIPKWPYWAAIYLVRLITPALLIP